MNIVTSQLLPIPVCGQLYVTDCYPDNLTATSQQSLHADEQQLAVASQLIAYAHQVFYPRGRFIFLRSLLSLLNK